MPPWSTTRAVEYLIKSIAVLLERWLEYIRSPLVSGYDRDEFPARLVDESLSKYLVAVQEDKELIKVLQNLQSRVRCIF